MPSILRSLALLLVTASLAAGCVYDFHPDYQGQAGFVSIEGDILIGTTCSFRVSSSTQLDDERDEGGPVACSIRVEASDGTVYHAINGTADLTAADPSLRYRLIVETEGPSRRFYTSAWSDVLVSPPIDTILWKINERKPSLMDICVSTHSDGTTGYYRWTANETWEFHAMYYAEVFFAPAGTEYKGVTASQDTIFQYADGENTWTCWAGGNQSGIMTGSTDGLTEDRLTGHTIYSLHSTDQKISHIYSAEITQMRLSEDAFLYWESVRSNSSDVGGLFSAEPSELRGNIVNQDDPDEMVLGFISASTCTRKRIFINNIFTGFSRFSYDPVKPIFPLSNEYLKYYNWGFRISFFDGDTGAYAWLPRRCTDCTLLGGTKERPSWWINNDK